MSATCPCCNSVVSTQGRRTAPPMSVVDSYMHQQLDCINERDAATELLRECYDILREQPDILVVGEGEPYRGDGPLNDLLPRVRSHLSDDPRQDTPAQPAENGVRQFRLSGENDKKGENP